MDELFSMIGAMAGVMLVVSLVALVFAIFSIICNWKIFVKMGAPGWASIIPLYCNWVLCDCVWGNALVSLAIIIPGIACSAIEGTLASVLSLIAVVIAYVTNWKKYKKFGKSTDFCVLGIFLPLITDAICAFGNSEFVD